MVSSGKIVKIVDAICDCTPGLSIITNAAKLVYKLAHKVNHAANPTKPHWSDDIKIHVLSKSKFDCIVGLIPFFGNLVNLVKVVLDGLPRHLMVAVVRNNVELVKLYLVNHPLTNPRKAEKILSQAAYSSNLETFNLILNSRAWDVETLRSALRSCWYADEGREKIANRILDYYHEKFKNQEIASDDWSSVSRVLGDFAARNRMKTAERLIEILPTSRLGDIEDVLVQHSYPSFSIHRKNRGVLTAKNREDIISRCKKCSIGNVTDFCRKISNRKGEMISDLNFHNSYKVATNSNLQKVDIEKITKEFDAVHAENLEKLLKVLDEGVNAKVIVSLLSKCMNNGEIEFLKIFLKRFENQLNTKDIVDVLGRVYQSYDDEAASRARDGFEFLFTRYSSNISDDQCQQLRKILADVHRSEPIRAIIEKLRSSK